MSWAASNENWKERKVGGHPQTPSREEDPPKPLFSRQRRAMKFLAGISLPTIRGLMGSRAGADLLATFGGRVGQMLLALAVMLGVFALLAQPLIGLLYGE